MTPSSPRSHHPRSWPLFALALALACFAIPAWAGVENPRDTPAVQAVQFDMAMVKRLDAVRLQIDGQLVAQVAENARAGDDDVQLRIHDGQRL